MKKRFKNSIIISLAVFAMLSITFIFSGAWFTDNDSKTAIITLGNKVDITAKATLPVNEVVMPGSTLTVNDIKGKAETDSSNMYVRAKVSVESQYSSVISATVSPLTSGWVELEGYMYYSAANSLTTESNLSNLTELAAGNETTALNLDLTISEDATQNEIDSTYLAPNSTIEVTITFEAIQSANTASKTIEEIWPQVSTNNSELGTATYTMQGDKVILKATPAENAVLVGWKNEQGEFVDYNSNNFPALVMLCVNLITDVATNNQLVAASVLTKLTETYPTLNFINPYAGNSDYTSTVVNFFDTNLDKINSEIADKIYGYGGDDNDVLMAKQYIQNIINQEYVSVLPHERYTAVFNKTSSTTSTAVDGYTFELYDEAKLAVITSCTLSEAIIPESITVNNITYSVASAKLFVNASTLKLISAFNTTNLTKVTIPSSFVEVPMGMFNRCENLTEATINANIKKIETYMFSDCSLLSNVNIPNTVSKMGEGAFYNCSSLTNIPVPTGVTNIGIVAFSGCTELTSIEIPSGVTNILQSTFNNCDALTSIKIPSNVTSIGDYAFYSCSALTSIDLPSELISIGDYAFEYCTLLGSIEIPSKVTSIGRYAFRFIESAKIAFKNATGWYVNSSTADFEQSEGTAVTVNAGTDETSAKANAYLLQSTYYNYYWKRF